MTDGEKEQIKLRATYLNGLALVFFGAGAVAPFFASSLTVGNDWLRILGGVFVMFTVFMGSWELHTMAQRHLRKLDE